LIDSSVDLRAAVSAPYFTLAAYTPFVDARTPAHDAVLALLDGLPEDVEVDAGLVAGLLGVPQAEGARLLDKLEAAGDVASATGRLGRASVHR
jgi:hypothetical protein